MKEISMLYAEDEPQARTLLLKLLQRTFPQLKLYVAVNGEEGVELFDQHHPELVLTDVTMPGVDGIEFSRHIRSVNPGTVIIALTAHNDAEFERRTRDIGFDWCIEKPVNFNLLLDIVGRAIEKVSLT